MMEEPSVLDYLKAKLTPWRGPAPQIPRGISENDSASESAAVPAGQAVQEISPQPTGMPESGSAAQLVVDQQALASLEYNAAPIAEPAAQEALLPLAQRIAVPWVPLVAFGLALLAQLSLEPGPQRTWTMGAVLYLLSAVCLGVSARRGEWALAPLPGGEKCLDPLTVRTAGLISSLIFGLAAFWAFGDNLLTRLNVILWLISVGTIIWAFWLPAAPAGAWLERLRSFWSLREWKISITRGTLAAAGAIFLVLFFRLHRLNQVPPEMFSDHAEKLLDVWDVLHGQTSIFFPRNTGREALQMYMTAGIIQLFNTGYSHLSLKIGTALAGLLTLPFIYLLGKEVGSKRIGLLAMVFAGIAYWPNVISRVGLRFPLYPLFVAPVLYFLLRGIRTSNRNDFILSGLFLGIGLHGYTPIRILPVVILVAVGIYLLHAQSRQVRKQTIWQLLILAVIALFVFLPLLRYATINPEGFSFRSFSRLGTLERPLPGPAWQIFSENLWNALTMFAWDDGEIWVVSLTHRPAMDVISAGLFFSGIVLLFIRYLRRRHWLDLFLLLSVPLLMLPSILSLAYPSENPALNRLSGAMVTMFLIVAIALDGLMTGLSTRLGPSLGSKVASALAVGCILLASLQNYGLVFNEYQQVFEQSAWNTSEMGEVIRQFTTSVGSEDTAWVLAYPHWVDTRLVGMNAGYPLKDYAIWPENLPETTADPRAKLFLVKPEDSQGLQALQSLYPQGVLQEYISEVDFHNFLMFFVPPAN